MPPEQKNPSLRGMAIGVVVVLMAIVGIGLVPHMRRSYALTEAEQAKKQPPMVRVAKVAPADTKMQAVLPGQTLAFLSTPLYAKGVAYVQRNHVDIGDRVKKGQLLADLVAPENDQAVRVAEARLAEASANVVIAQRSADRNTRLAEAGVVPRERADDTVAQANSAVAQLHSSKAEVGRLSAVRGYQRVVAPFDGVITRRTADPGALVGTSATGVPLFEVAQIETLRVFVDVPQAWVDDVPLSATAEVYQPSRPERITRGKVVRQSGALEPSTRTMRTEVQVPGGQGILPGAFVYVRFSVVRKDPPLIIPAAALLIRKEGTQVARVEKERVHLQPITLGRDYGKEIEVVAGLTAGDQVVINPSDLLNEGMPVRVAPQEPPRAR